MSEIELWPADMRRGASIWAHAAAQDRTGVDAVLDEAQTAGRATELTAAAVGLIVDGLDKVLCNPQTVAGWQRIAAQYAAHELDIQQQGKGPTEMTEPTQAESAPAHDLVDNEIVNDPTPRADVGDVNAEEQDGPFRDASKYRKRAQAAEAERDAIASRLEVMIRSEAERRSAAKLADPQDLWRDGAQLADVLDDAGQIDADKLDGLIGTVLDAHRHWAKPTHPAAAPAREVTANGRITGGDTPNSFEDAFRPRSE